MIVDDFNHMTGLRLDLYISRFRVFVDTHLPRMISYYAGSTGSMSSEIISELSYLTGQSKVFNEAVVSNEWRFDNSEYWDVAEVLDDMKARLETIVNTPRWVRSTSTHLDMNTQTEVDASLPSLNTVEDLAQSYGYQDPDNSWVKIAMRNDLDEVDYTTDGGNTLKINISGNIGIVINDVVDIMYGMNAYGKDFNKKLTYENDDLLCVSGEECVIQCYEILIGLSKGDIPEHQEMGMGAVMGGTMSAFSYPAVLRQINRTMYRDDSVESVSIIKFDTYEDIIVMDIRLQSKFGLYIKKGLSI